MCKSAALVRFNLQSIEESQPTANQESYLNASTQLEGDAPTVPSFVGQVLGGKSEVSLSLSG